MPNQDQSVTYQNLYDSNADEGDVVLEQVVGTRLRYPSSLDLAKLTGHLVFGVVGTSQVYCGIDEETGEFIGDGLAAWTSSFSVSYRIGLTNGRLTGGVSEVENIEEIVNFNNSNSGSIKYPTSSITSVEWLTGPWDIDGNDIYGVTLSVSGRNVRASKSVYGSALVKYTSYKKVRNMIVTAHPDTDSNVYECYAWAAWTGGTTLMQVDPPTGTELKDSEGTTCQDTSTTRPDRGDESGDGDGDGDDRPEGEPYDYTIEYDYCTGEVIE